MKLGLKKIIIVGKIILPPVLCVLLILYLEHYIEYQFIFVFGISIILFNYGKTKYHFLVSILISIILSYFVFFLSFAIHLGTSYILTGGDSEKELQGFFLGVPFPRLHALISISIISPLLMFYFYKFLFKIEENKEVIWIKIISIIILFTVGLNDFFFSGDNIYVIWEFTMAIALQLMLYKRELQNDYNILHSK